MVYILGKQIHRQVIGLLLFRQIVQGEGELIGSGPLRIVAQLRLDFSVGIGAVGVRAHQDVGPCGNCSPHVSQTCALPEHRIIAGPRAPGVGPALEVLHNGHSR